MTYENKNHYARAVKSEDPAHDRLIRVDDYPAQRSVLVRVCKAPSCRGCDKSACTSRRSFDYTFEDIQTREQAIENAIAYAHGLIDGLIDADSTTLAYHGRPAQGTGPVPQFHCRQLPVVKKDKVA